MPTLHANTVGPRVALACVHGRNLYDHINDKTNQYHRLTNHPPQHPPQQQKVNFARIRPCNSFCHLVNCITNPRLIPFTVTIASNTPNTV